MLARNTGRIGFKLICRGVRKNAFKTVFCKLCFKPFGTELTGARNLNVFIPDIRYLLE